MFVFHGDGANGKTTLMEAVRGAVGDYGGQILIEALLQSRHGDGAAASPDIADLSGRRFVSCSEPAEGLRLNEARIKYLTGAWRIKARFLHSNPFEFTPTFKLFFDCNYRPVIRDDSAAMWDRVREIPFRVRIPASERDKKLADKLRAEAPGILAWLLRGCLAWQRDGLGLPKSVAVSTSDYRRAMNPVADFLAARCVFDPRAKVKAESLYRAYAEWAKTGAGEPLSRNAFARRVTLDHRVQRRRTLSDRLYVGLCLDDDREALRERARGTA